MTRSCALLIGIVVFSACAQTLPDHDNRIFTSVPVAKLSAANLAAAFVADQAEAADRYAGRAIEVSGVIEDLSAEPGSPGTFLLSGGDAGRHVRVSLHEDRAQEILKTLTTGQRATFRCFCEGLTDHVQLKSCVVP